MGLSHFAYPSPLCSLTFGPYYTSQFYSKNIEIKIIDDDEYEKKEEFYIRLSGLEDLNGTPGGDGIATFGENVKCTVEITEDHLFKSRSDKVHYST